MSLLDRGRLLTLAAQRALALVRRRQLERWLAEPDERPAGSKEDER